MSKTPDISEAEWKVMKVLWADSPQSAGEVVNKLAQVENWHPNTIKTLLSRLLKKKAVGVRREHKLNQYFPAVSEEDSVHAETKTFIDRVFGGSVKPLLVHFAQKEKLTQGDLDELREILNKKE